MYCIYCGKKISDDSLFCVYCGQKQELSKKPIKKDIELESKQINDEKAISCKTIKNNKSHKIDWNKKRNDFADGMNPCPVWNIGTDSQQEFADSLVNNFCKRVAKYLCWALKDHIVDEVDVDSIVNSIFYAINDIDDAKWWCNKKNSSDCKIALNLLDDDNDKENIKKIYKFYDHD